MASHICHGRMAAPTEILGSIRSLQVQMGLITSWSRLEHGMTTLLPKCPVGRRYPHGTSESMPSQKQEIADPGRVPQRSMYIEQIPILHRPMDSENGVPLSISRLCLWLLPWSTIL